MVSVSSYDFGIERPCSHSDRFRKGHKVNRQESESSMLLEIREQGDVLARVMSHSKGDITKLAISNAGKRLHFIGCGDMCFAASQVEAVCESLWGVSVRAWRSMDLRWAHRRLTVEDLVVAASVSGRTPRTIEAAVLAQEAGAKVVGITDNPGSPLHDALDDALILGTTSPELLQDELYPGYRNIIAQTQTFTAVLLVELILAAEMSGVEYGLEWVPQRVRELAGTLEDAARELAEAFFVGGRQVVVLGSGPHWPVACYGAAKMLEFAVPATAQCIEEFNHLQAFVADAGTRIIVLAADDAAESRAAELVGAWQVVGARSLVLARSYDFRSEHARVFPLPCEDLLDAVICQLVALQLLVATGVAAMGRDPNRWLGGWRTEQVQSMNNQTVRGSRLWRPGE